MKPFFTLLLAFMISLSLTGQQNLNELNDLQKLHDLKKESLSRKHFQGLSKSENSFCGDLLSATKYTLENIRQIQKSPQKSALATTMQMDSLLLELNDTVNQVWALYERELYSYDGNGNMLSSVSYEFDSLEMKILPNGKQTVVWTPQGYPTEAVMSGWEKESGQWIDWIKFEMIYDGNGNLMQNVTSRWDSLGSQWLVVMQIDMTYDGGNLVEGLMYRWDEDSAKLVLWSKDEYIYVDGKLTTVNDYYLDEGDWVLTSITTYTYDGQGNMTLELTQTEDMFTQEWTDYSKFIWTYDANNRTISEEYWDSELNMQTFQFEIVRKWKYLYTWDEDGNMIEEVEQSWDKDAEAWQDDGKSVWFFNKSYTIMDLNVPYFWYPGNTQGDGSYSMFHHMPVSETGYKYINGQWVESSRRTAYFSESGSGGPTGIEDVNKAPVSVFPNPASEFITFSWDEKYTRLDLEIYDLTGKRVISRSIENNAAIRLDGLSKGVYLYKLSNSTHLVDIGKISFK